MRLVIQLQDLDKRIDEIRKEVSALPKHIAGIEKTLESHVRKLEADSAALTANQRERKKLEAEIQVQEQKTSKLKDQMMEAKTNEVYRAFQSEIEYCQKEIRKAEDRILDLMSESEPLDHNLKLAQEALQEEKHKVEAEKQSARARAAAAQEQLGELQRERQSGGAKLGPTVLAAYERIRKKRRGIAVAEVIDGHCSACHLTLRLQFFQDVRAGEEVMFCESCGRILYYNLPASFEDVESHTQAETPPLHTSR